MVSSQLTFVFALASLILIHGNNAEEEQHNGGHDLSFSYIGNNGPAQWGSISPAYKKCRSGKTQSPIDIVVDQVVINKNLAPLSTEYFPVNATLINHKYLVEVRLGNAGKFKLNGKDYTLTQMHWHTPSEHRINGIQYDAEGHLVHFASDGSIAVIGMVYKIGKADPFLLTIQNKFGEIGKEMGAILKVKKIETNNLQGTYYRYMGSLTTPPCSEDITWTLLTEVKSISKEQIDLLDKPLDPSCKPNCRPVQPLNYRHVEINSCKPNGRSDQPLNPH